ncbi:hypothetical protein VKT23_008698 [Stygiomarasmius scandens]|uniref:Uncharacterized protein n=1 Tax=Marasmiellus scandens TaxID=2682957 RepID=A0ABR1JH64_9AGAR
MSSAQLQSPFTIRQAFVDAIRLVIHALDGGTPFPSGLAPADSSISHPTDPVPQLQWLTLETPIIAQGSFRFMIRDGPRWADRHIDHLFLPLETELRLAGQHLLALRDRARIWSMIRPIIQWLKAMARISQFFTRLSQLFPGNIRIVYSPNFHALVDQSFEAYKCLLLDDALYRRYWALGGLEFAPVHLHVHRLEVGEGWNVLWNDAYWHDRIPASIFEVESWTHAPMQRPSAPTDPNLHAVFTPTSQIDFSLIIEEDVYPEAAKPNPSASTSVPPNSGAVSERSPSVELIPDANVTPEMRTQCSSSGPSRKRRRVVDSDYESPYARSRSSSPPDPTISRNPSTTPEPPASPQKKKARRSRRTPTPQESSDDDDVPLRSRVSSASRFTRAQKRKGRAASPTPTLSEDEENDVKPLRKPKAKKPSASKSDKKMPGVLSLQSAKLALRAPLSDIDLPYIPPRPYTDSDHVQEPVSVNGVLLPKPADRERSILRRREYQQRNAATDATTVTSGTSGSMTPPVLFLTSPEFRANYVFVVASRVSTRRVP